MTMTEQISRMMLKLFRRVLSRYSWRRFGWRGDVPLNNDNFLMTLNLKVKKATISVF